MMPIREVFNEDNMIGMARYPDKFFDLAIVDPPYGIGEAGKNMASRHHSQRKYKVKNWDSEPPPIEYFSELRRVSKNQIIWGANHFISRIPIDSSCWLFWNKDRYGDFADGELAWTSFKTALRMYKFTWDGFRKQIQEDRFHPTQKPTNLYKWILQSYAQPGYKILDTHMGSQSSRIAAYQMGFDYYGWEIDKEYFEAGNKRFIEQTAQLKLL
jgi:site-specific DNA-methyltransferase (adenine-specific)